MGLDIKIPIGLMFVLYGIILTIFGIITSSNVEMYKMSLNVNINLWSGLFMFVFGGLMLLFTKNIFKKKK